MKIMKKLYLFSLIILLFSACNNSLPEGKSVDVNQAEISPLAQDVVNETKRSWQDYKQ